MERDSEIAFYMTGGVWEIVKGLVVGARLKRKRNFKNFMELRMEWLWTKDGLQQQQFSGFPARFTTSPLDSTSHF